MLLLLSGQNFYFKTRIVFHIIVQFYLQVQLDDKKFLPGEQITERCMN